MKRTETRILLDSAPIKARLDFGVNNHVRLKNIDNIPRKNKDGIALERNCNLTFAKYDEDGKQVAESSFDYFNITPGKNREFAIDNLIQQVTQLSFIAYAVIPKDDLDEEEIDDYFNEPLIDYADIFEKKKLTEKDAKKLLECQKKIAKAAEDLLLKYKGEAGDWIDLLVVTDRTGGYPQLPSEGSGFIAKEEDEHKFTIPGKYYAFKDNVNKQEKSKSDDIGDDIPMDEDNLDDLDDTLEELD